MSTTADEHRTDSCRPSVRCYGDQAQPVGRSALPEWFAAALRRERHTGEVDVDGATIRYLAWGERGRPTTILVHGGAAHAMWWAPIAAWLDPDRYVVALDLSGHGCSGHRPVYSVEHWATEVVAVAEAVATEPPTVVAHSLGGIVTSHALTRPSLGARFRRAVLVDAPVWPGAPAPEQPLSERQVRPHRTYASAGEALARFRLVPAQPCHNDYYVDHVAWHSLRPGEPGDGEPPGWQWRFDPRIFADPTGDHRITRFDGGLAGTHCPVAVIMGERSYLAAGAGAALADGGTTPLRFVPDAAHHVMLDQPLALLSRLRDLLGSWP